MTSCPGPGFTINSNGSLGLTAPRSVTWPFTGAIGTYNGLRMDATGGLWTEPPTIAFPIQWSGSLPLYTNLTATTTLQFYQLGQTTVTNPDSCRSLLVTGNALMSTVVETLTTPPTNVVISLDVLSQASGILVTTNRNFLFLTNSYLANNAFFAASWTAPFSITLAPGASDLLTFRMSYQTSSGTSRIDSAVASMTALCATPRATVL